MGLIPISVISKNRDIIHTYGVLELNLILMWCSSFGGWTHIFHGDILDEVTWMGYFITREENPFCGGELGI